jgi:hypothetical protein
VVLHAMQHSFTKGGLGGGQLIPGQFIGLVSAVSELPQGWRGTMLKRAFLWPMDIGLSMIHARRNRTVATINKVYDEIGERTHLSPRQRVVSGTKEIGDAINLYRYGFIRCLLPAERRVSEMAFRFRADHEATLVALALKQYHAEVGEYPADLESLVDVAYIDRVPVDPYSDNSLIYKCFGDEFLLYSVGPDFVDDGGKPGVDDEGRPKTWADSGDRVFWPVSGSLE